MTQEPRDSPENPAGMSHLCWSLPLGTHVMIAHDGFAGTVQGYYETREGKRGVVLQQHGTRVVHVYGEKWLSLESDDAG